jgi:hypothetical protein
MTESNKLENSIKISDQQRIMRILKRICEAGLPLLIRGTKATTVSVKGRAAHIMANGPNNVQVMRISNISEKGINHLMAQGRVQVEFVMMATKVMFISSVISREDQSVFILLPTTLVSIERRKNARYNCTQEVRAFFDLSSWRPDEDDLGAPPIYPHYRHIGAYIAISDLSFGGLCGVTRFPSSCIAIKRGVIDDGAGIILPMIGRIPCSIEVRWIKKIKEHHRDSEGRDMHRRIYKFGAQFVSQSDLLKVSIRQFIAKISEAGAI